MALQLLCRHSDGDGLSGIKVLLAPVSTRNSLLRDIRARGSIVGKQGRHARERSARGSLDHDVSTARVQLAVTLVVVPDPVQDDLVARGCIGRDRHGHVEGASGGRISQAGLEMVLNDLLTTGKNIKGVSLDFSFQEFKVQFCSLSCIEATPTTQVAPLS